MNHNTHQEYLYVAAVLQRPNTLTKHPIALAYFFDEPMKQLLQACISLIGTGQELNTTLLYQRYGKEAWWPGAAVVSELEGSFVSEAVLKSTTQAILNAGKRRAFLEWQKHAALAAENEKDFDFEASFFSFINGLEKNADQNRYEHFYSIGKSWFSSLLDGGEATYKVKTGETTLDNNLILDAGGLHVIAGRTGMGKTSFALWVASQVAKQGTPVLFFSLEMTKEQLLEKVLAEKTRTNSYDLVKRFSVYQQQIATALSEQEQIPFYVNDTGKQTVESICVHSNFAKTERNIGLIVVDYLQMVKSNTKHHSREQEVAHVSCALKTLAKQLKIPVIALAQLNRESDARASKRPMLSDLRESGSIEMDADTVSLLYRPEYYCIMEKKPVPDEQKGVIEINVAKQRRIGPRIIGAYWEPATNHFSFGQRTFSSHKFVSAEALYQRG